MNIMPSVIFLITSHVPEISVINVSIHFFNLIQAKIVIIFLPKQKKYSQKLFFQKFHSNNVTIFCGMWCILNLHMINQNELTYLICLSIEYSALYLSKDTCPCANCTPLMLLSVWFTLWTASPVSELKH